MSMRLRTVDQPAEISGIGLHTGHHGTLRLLPSERPGWTFRRVEAGGGASRMPTPFEIEADVSRVQQTSWSTTLGGTHGLLHCCEHLLAALHAMQVSAVTAEVDADEIPIADGSALPFVQMIERAGTREVDRACSQFRVGRECWVSDGDKHVLAIPDNCLRITSAVDYDHPLAPAQLFSIVVTPESFAEEVAPARTFALAEWIENLQKAGLIKGGSLENALVIFPDHYSSDLRFPDEMARHKALDLIGDLALLGKPVIGHFIAVKASHALHVELIRKMMSGDYLILET